MELYFKNKEGQLEETNLFDQLCKSLDKSGFRMSNGRFEGENHNWIGIIQGSELKQVLTNITFEDDGNTITGIKVYETPIKRVLDDDNSKQII